MPRSALALSLALALAAVTVPSSADACGNTVRRVVDRTQEYVQKADLQLAKGQYKRAVTTIRAAFGDQAIAIHVGPGGLLHGRAQRILALAVARSDGEVAIGMNLGGPVQSRRDAAIAWSVLTLRLTAGEQPAPARTAELAEALAHQPSGRSEAYLLLKKLGDDDLMPGAHAWALLAELSDERGDLEASAQAIARCQQIGAPRVKCDLTKKT